MLFFLLLLLSGFAYLLAASRRAQDRQVARLSTQDTLAVQQRGDALKEYVRTLPDFRFTHCLFSRDYATAVALEETTGRVCLLDAAGPGIFHRVLPASGLLAVTLAEDGHAVSETRPAGLGRTVAGTLAGDLLLGPVGAVLGGLWFSRQMATVTALATALEIQLTVNDTRAPFWRVGFLPGPTRRDSPAYRKAREVALQWQALLQVVVHRGRLDVAPKRLTLPV